MQKLFLLLLVSALFWDKAIVRAEEIMVYTVGLEVHASRSMPSEDTERISRYLFHNIAKWSEKAIVLYQGDTRGAGATVDLNVVVYVSKYGHSYSLFVENTDEVALRKELTDKGLSKDDIHALLGDPKKPLSRTDGTSWGTVPATELVENLDGIVKDIVSVLRRVQQEAPPSAKIKPAANP